MRERKKEHDRNNRQQRYDRDKRFWDKRRETALKQYTEWRERVSKIPFKQLTEDDWLETCRHFEGCAICGNEHIETRHYFVQFKEGGQYAPWNIFPMCSVCSKTTRRILNPFAWLDKYLGRASNMNITEERANKLIAYLQSQIEKVENNEQKTSSI